MTATESTRLLEAGELQLADYKLAAGRSDLDAIKMKLEHAAQAGSVDEYLRIRDTTGATSLVEVVARPTFDREELARIVVFATDAIADAESVRSLAMMIHDLALDLDHLSSDRAYCPESLARISAWHAEAQEVGHAG